MSNQVTSPFKQIQWLPRFTRRKRSPAQRVPSFQPSLPDAGPWFLLAHPLHSARTGLFPAPPICQVHRCRLLNWLYALSGEFSADNHIINPPAVFKSLLKCQLRGEAYPYQFFKTVLSLSLCPGNSWSWPGSVFIAAELQPSTKP